MHLKQLFVFSVYSGWKRVSQTSRRGSTGDRTSSAMSPTTMSTTGFGRRSSSVGRPTVSTSRLSSPSGTVPCSRGTLSRARRRSLCSTTSSTPPPGNLHHGSLRATSLLVSYTEHRVRTCDMHINTEA